MWFLDEQDGGAKRAGGLANESLSEVGLDVFL